MKKVLSLILVSVILITITTNVFASGLFDDLQPISPDEYNNAQTQPENTTKNNSILNTNANTNNNIANNNTSLPQTGIEDSGMGILLIVCVACAIFAYKKVSDYRNI